MPEFCGFARSAGYFYSVLLKNTNNILIFNVFYAYFFWVLVPYKSDGVYCLLKDFGA